YQMPRCAALEPGRRGGRTRAGSSAPSTMAWGCSICRASSAGLTCAPRAATWGCRYGTPGLVFGTVGGSSRDPGRWGRPTGRPAMTGEGMADQSWRGALMSDEHQQTQAPEQAAVAAQPDSDARPAAVPGPPQMPAAPVSAAERVRLAAQRRGESDYIFSYWTALGWTILTL